MSDSTKVVMCHQCPGKRAIFLAQFEGAGMTGLPLCLDCYFKYSQIMHDQLENLERQSNHAVQQMEFISGVHGVAPKYPPRPKPTYIQGAKLNNITVNGGIVGTINTGTVGTVDQSITFFNAQGDGKTGNALKVLSEAILASADLTRNQRDELMQLLSEIAKQASVPKDARDVSATTWVERAMTMTAAAADIADKCAQYWPVLAAVLGVPHG
jgi:hypothetical protein